MRIPLFRLLPWLALCAFGLAACQSNQDAPAQAIESYLAAKVESDVDAMTRLSCPAWEPQAQIEATSFASMDAQLDSVSCTVGAADGDYTLVNCTGQIVTAYQGENRTWSVSDHPYRALLNDGEYLMCGYGQ